MPIVGAGLLQCQTAETHTIVHLSGCTIRHETHMNDYSSSSIDVLQCKDSSGFPSSTKPSCVCGVGVSVGVSVWHSAPTETTQAELF